MSIPNQKRIPSRRYALVTAAYNEEAYIEQMLSSVVSQTDLPSRWIVVSDASNDQTDTIVRKYADRFSFIELRRIEKEHERNFAAQVNAINAAFDCLDRSEYDYIGNLDADISLPPTYFARLLRKFENNPDLGLAGGYIYEAQQGHFKPRRNNNVRSVPHGVQLFRSSCFVELGGYVALPYGGPDWHAEIKARMNGWRVESYPDVPAFHHRPTGTAAGLLRYWYRQGLMDFSLGSHPFVEILRCVRRFRAKPYVLGGFARIVGFASAYLRRERRPVPDEFVAFLRAEQWTLVRGSLLRALRGPNAPA